MKIHFVNQEDSIIAVGFRKMASFARSIHPDTKNFFLTLNNFSSPVNMLLGKTGSIEEMDFGLVREIAEPLAKADMVCFSSMTGYSKMTKSLIKEIKLLNPRVFIVWGGIHPIIHPEDAITHADAICTGEGEFAFEEFLNSYREGRDYFNCRNFWFRKGEEIIRNDFLPLATNEEMEKFPLPLYGEDELIFKAGRGFSEMTVLDYLNFNGLGFNTVWSIGCPYKCTYCGNTKFIENDKNYTKIRHTSVDYLVNQLKLVSQKHPHVSTVIFHDDSFMALPKNLLREFCDKWKREVAMPFCVQGVIPSFVNEEKMEFLVDAGLNRVRMGVQSGSDRILKFYERPNKLGLIHSAAGILSKFSDKMIPPAFDIILDNPIETRQDVLDTLNMLYYMPRPYTLNVFSLKVIPNTVLESQFLDMNISVEEISANYLENIPTVATILVFLLPVWKPPRFVYDFLLKFVQPSKKSQIQFPIVLWFVRAIWLIRRGISHVKMGDFSLIRGPVGWIFWKLGFTASIKKHL
ncbi:MAG: hypothetical protein COV66_10695 [Nitrospinae bacterium CG11_big_fil_rev_8_21_14_0_20_45_15]|nr:MAG: hypothetical protein COV66_10695 [Nitrospinae bacterium CG11_big_fil_rev_8_21_14_0_20_45_15]